MGPALFELYSTGLSSSNARQGSLTGTSLKHAEEVAKKAKLATSPNSSAPKPLARESSFKAATNFFSSRKNSDAQAALQSKSNAMTKTMSLDQGSAVALRESLAQQPVRSYRVKYIGNTVLDRRYTLPMLPWIIADIKRQGYDISVKDWKAKDIFLQVTETALKATSISDARVLFVHPLATINKFTQTAQDKTCFTYLTRESADSQFNCHVFQATDESVVSFAVSFPMRFLFLSTCHSVT